MAYSLMVIFDVNMPLLYGEGKKAFLRLQLEIIKKSDDESIFAWTSTDNYSGMLATWPSAFTDSGDIMSHYLPSSMERRPYAMTNKGLEFYVPLPSVVSDNVSESDDDAAVRLTLDCWKHGGKVPLAITVHLQKWGDTWRRVGCATLDHSNLSMKKEKDLIKRGETAPIYVKQDGI